MVGLIIMPVDISFKFHSVPISTGLKDKNGTPIEIFKFHSVPISTYDAKPATKTFKYFKFHSVPISTGGVAAFAVAFYCL